MNSLKRGRASRGYSALVFLFFLAIFTSTLIERGITKQLVYYAASILCLGVYIIEKLIKKMLSINKNIFIFMFLCILTGISNFVLIRNTGVSDIIECAILNTVMAIILNEKRIKLEWLEAIIYIECAYFVYKFLSVGFYARVMTLYSNNAVSIALLIPLAVYYALVDLQNESLKIMPVIVAWVISLFAKGRSGIIIMTFLLICIVAANYYHGVKNGHVNKWIYVRQLLYRIFVILLLTGISYYILSNYTNVVFSKFYRSGTDDTGRFLIWTEYLHYAFNRIKYFIFGVPYRMLLIGNFFGGNSHNSFISIHAKNGIVMLTICLIFLSKSIKWAINNKKYVYMVSLLAFCMRSFFDNVFWGTRGTTTFIFFLFTPYIISSYKKDLSQQEEIY
ncbi:MAG: hypothetical protein IKF22_07280 [Lachnospiraceae bacterium]|nr:hypothetical protein [Lachnospiraceae bacterium]